MQSTFTITEHVPTVAEQFLSFLIADEVFVSYRQ